MLKFITALLFAQVLLAVPLPEIDHHKLNIAEGVELGISALPGGVLVGGPALAITYGIDVIDQYGAEPFDLTRNWGEGGWKQ